jgi:ATP-binding cassette subfamily B multidrug efflux pump
MVPALAAPPTKTLGSYLRPYWRSLAIGGAFLLLTNVVDKSIPWLLQHAIDALIAQDLTVVRNYALVVLVLAAVMWIVRIFVRASTSSTSGRDVEFDLRNEIIDKVHTLGPSFFRRMPTGEIMSRATNDLGQLRLLVGFGALNVVNSVMAYVGAIALMTAISPRLTLLALVPYPAFILVARGFGKALYDRSRDAQAALGTLSDRAQENLAGVRVVRAFGLEPQQNARFEEANQDAIRANMRLVVTRGFMWPALMLIGSSRHADRALAGRRHDPPQRAHGGGVRGLQRLPGLPGVAHAGLRLHALGGAARARQLRARA